MTLAPGTKDHSSKGFQWDRDVEKDLDTLGAGTPPAHMLVCLLEHSEFERYGIHGLEAGARARGIEYMQFPIPDMGAPASVEGTIALVGAIVERLHSGKNVVVHCRGGIGRTGTIVGCVLAQEGLGVDAAFQLMQTVRGERDMPQTAAQRDFVRAYARRAAGRPAAGPVNARASTAPPPQSPDLLELLLRGGEGDIASANARAQRKPVHGARQLVAQAEAAIAANPSLLAFDETEYATLSVAGRVFSAGRFAVQTIGQLRRAVRLDGPGRVTVSALSGRGAAVDIGALQASASSGTIFQAASQFNCLEAPGPSLTKVSHYFDDSTQGPRASISAFPGTLLRHYAAPGEHGARFVQTAGTQVNLLARALPAKVGRVECGYLMTQNIRDLGAAANALEDAFEDIAVGVHDGVQVVFGNNWDGAVDGAPRIAQVFTSAFAASYSHRSGSPDEISGLCRPILRAAYLGTLLAAVSVGRPRVLLTLIGGGAFGNPADVIWESVFWAADEAAKSGATLQVVVNAHMSGVPDFAKAECRNRGGRAVVVD
ncbi:MAG: hypothetical protein K8W52_21680 [Deltaproteobacteria bacterium]|nr:hypothetical protein [Deltaproteobacteria bacterium]